MKTSTINQKSGIAIIVVMIAIAVLSFMTALFAYNMKVETRLAMNANSEVELVWLGRSGVEYARYLLAQQVNVADQPYDGLNQVWAGGPGGDTNNFLSSMSLTDYPLGAGKFSIKIVDLERKVNINIVDDQVLQQAFTVMGLNPSDSSAITDAILDWIDPNDDPRPNGAESSYYQGLNPPYYSKNAPIDDLAELLLVRGVTPEMYWGTDSTNHPPAFFQGQFGQGHMSDDSSGYTCGMVDLFTPISTGKININTASLQVLQVIPSIDENIANDIIRQRAGPDGQDGTDDDVPFQNVGELVNVGIGRDGIATLSRFCDVRSHTFEVTVDAQIGNYKRQFIAIVGRNSATDLPILSFYWK